mgnify:FL=1
MGKKTGVEVIPGIELSCDYMGGEVHILGYYLDWRSPLLSDLSVKIKKYRHDRGALMVEKLASLGYAINFEEVKAVAGSEFIGRPHIAEVLIKKGYAKNFDDAFANLIGKGQPGYVERFKLTPHEAVAVIIKCKGIPVLAHPGLFKPGEAIGEALIDELIVSGLKGIEVFHSKHNFLVSNYYTHLAAAKKLLITGGSDCHGGLSGEILMGNIKIPYRLVAKLKENLP